jgi:hypothetical protein
MMADQGTEELYQRPQVRRAVLAFMSQLGNKTHKALNTSNNSNCRYNKEKNLWELVYLFLFRTRVCDKNNLIVPSAMSTKLMKRPKMPVRHSYQTSNSIIK